MNSISTTSTPAPGTVSTLTPSSRASLGWSWDTENGVIIVREAERQKVKITRNILWRKGDWVVVEGPFPHMFSRSETRSSVDKASKLSKSYIMARPETFSEGNYALCHKSDVIEVLSGDNEFGVVSP